MEPELLKRHAEQRQRLRQHLIFERLLTSGQTFQAEDTAPEIDREKRTAVFSFASEVPVLRWFGYERLNIRSGSIDLERINASGPLLLDHDPGKQIGVVEKAWRDGDKLYAKVRFSRSSFGEEIFQDVIDGIRRNVSFNYVFPVEGFIFEGFTEDGVEMYRVDQFDIREVSIVSIPADFRVGIGRSLSDSDLKLKESFENHYKEKLKMDDELEGMEGKPGAEKATKEKPSKEKTIKASRSMSLEDDDETGDSSEAADIIAFGEAYNQKDLAVKFIKEGRSLSEFRTAIKQKIASKHVQSPMTYKVEGEMGFEEREVRQFSILRALASMVVKNYRGGGYEQEVSEATMKKYGGNRQGHGGIAIPPEVFFYRADPILSTPKPGNAAQTGGANLVGTDTMGSEFIKAFWERLVIGRAGARFMRGLVGNVVIPKQTGKAKAQWVAEGVAPTGSQQTFGQVPMAPKRIADFIDISRLNLLQSSMDMEAFIREDLQAAVAAAVDAAAIYGSGQNLEPRGILSHPDVDVAVELGADALQFEDIIDMETAVAENNADVDSMVYITNARVRGYLKSVPEAPLTSKMIWTSSGGGEGVVNGYRALATNHVPSNLGTGRNLSAMVFGNFRDLIIGQWGALFLQENPYLNQSAGLVRIDIEQQMDLILRHGESFSVIKTIDTTKRPSFLRTVGSTATDGGGTTPPTGRSVRRSRKVTEGNDDE